MDPNSFGGLIIGPGFSLRRLHRFRLIIGPLRKLHRFWYTLWGLIIGPGFQESYIGFRLGAAMNPAVDGYVDLNPKA